MGVSAGRAKDAAEPVRRSGTVAEVFVAFLKLGCTSFGGPIAHLGYFRSELIVRRRWLDDRRFEIGLSSCRDRVCLYVLISFVSVSFKLIPSSFSSLSFFLFFFSIFSFLFFFFFTFF